MSSHCFLKSLGSPKFIAAPMVYKHVYIHHADCVQRALTRLTFCCHNMFNPQVHQSELAFRILTRQNGCELAFTQMIQAHKYATSQKFRDNICDWQTKVELDRPLIVQLNGHDPESLVATGQLLAGTVDGIDLNLGNISLLLLLLCQCLMLIHVQ
jgi:hypothetical protein